MLIPNAINGIDVSSSNGNVDFAKVKAAGFDFVYIQSSRYSSVKDAGYLGRVEQAEEAGLKVGAYHFCSHNTDPVAQAEFFYYASVGLGKNSGDLPPMADWEYCTPAKYPDHPAHCVRWIETFTEKCDELWGFYPGTWGQLRKTVLYTYPNYAATHQPALKLGSLGSRPLCFASYSNANGYVPASASEVPFHKVPDGLGPALLVQYSGDKGAPVAGLSGACDRQVFTGTKEEWNEFLGL